MRRIITLNIVLAVLLGVFRTATAATLTLPKDLKTIGKRAFYRDASLDKVIIPEGTERIEELAFAYSGLQYIKIPNTVYSIAENAFKGINGLTIDAPEGSRADMFARALAGNSQDWSVGSKVCFGRYDQDNDLTNGKEHILWRVLDRDGSSVLLLSEHVLDVTTYMVVTNTDFTWKDCLLRNWLNGDFINTAFNSAEQAVLKSTFVDNSQSQGFAGLPQCDLEISTTCGNNTNDRVFLLSLAQAYQYLGGERYEDNLLGMWWWRTTNGAATPTPYVRAKYHINNDNIGWWLRSQGYDHQDSVATVRANGSIGLDYTFNEWGIRPAIWIDLEAGTF